MIVLTVIMMILSAITKKLKNILFILTEEREDKKIEKILGIFKGEIKQFKMIIFSEIMKIVY